VKWSSDREVAGVCMPADSSRTRRVYIRELAPFLGESNATIMRIARKHGWLRDVRPAPKWFHNFYVSEQAAQRIIIYCRSKQGGRCLDGRDYFAERERMQERTRRYGAVAKARTEHSTLKK
jgi:hypothetical protein